MHDAVEVAGQLPGGHGVGGEHVLTVGALEEQVRRHEVDTGVAARRILDDQQGGDRRSFPGAVIWIAARYPLFSATGSSLDKRSVTYQAPRTAANAMAAAST